MALAKPPANIVPSSAAAMMNFRNLHHRRHVKHLVNYTNVASMSSHTINSCSYPIPAGIATSALPTPSFSFVDFTRSRMLKILRHFRLFHLFDISIPNLMASYPSPVPHFFNPRRPVVAYHGLSNAPELGFTSELRCCCRYVAVARFSTSGEQKLGILRQLFGILQAQPPAHPMQHNAGYEDSDWSTGYEEWNAR